MVTSSIDTAGEPSPHDRDGRRHSFESGDRETEPRRHAHTRRRRKRVQVGLSAADVVVVVLTRNELNLSSCSTYCIVQCCCLHSAPSESSESDCGTVGCRVGSAAAFVTHAQHGHSAAAHSNHSLRVEHCTEGRRGAAAFLPPPFSVSTQRGHNAAGCTKGALSHITRALAVPIPFAVVSPFVPASVARHVSATDAARRVLRLSRCDRRAHPALDRQ